MQPGLVALGDQDVVRAASRSGSRRGRNPADTHRRTQCRGQVVVHAAIEVNERAPTRAAQTLPRHLGHGRQGS